MEHSNSQLISRPFKYRTDIDILRALAVLSVIFYHYFPTIFPGGYVGVDFFFTISGYLISKGILLELKQEQFSFRSFYLRRVRRIFPALIVILTLVLVLGNFVLFKDEYKQLGRHIFSGAFFISNLTLWSEINYFDKSSDLKPLLHLWSLGIEEQFYIFFPWILFTLYKTRQNIFKSIFYLSIASLLACVYFTYDNSTNAFYNPLTRIWELLFGAMVACCHTHMSPWTARIKPAKFLLKAKKNIWYICLPLLLGPVFLFSNETAFPGLWALLPVLGASGILLTPTKTSENSRILKLLIFVGLISYPLYLWHWLMLSFAHIIRDGPPALGYRVFSLIVIFILAWLTYRLIEKPIRKYSSNSVAYLLVTCLFLIGCLGAFTDHRDGFPGRQIQQAIQNNDFSFPPIFRHECEGFPINTDGWCNRGNVSLKDAPDVLLLGDSLATSFSQTLHEASQSVSFHFRQLGSGQCPILLDYGPKFCRTATRLYFQYLAKQPQIKLVILASSWGAYAKGYDYSWLNERTTAREFRIALRKTLEKIQSLKKSVVIVLEPAHGAKPKKCLRMKFMGVNKSCKLPISKIVAQNLLRDQAMSVVTDDFSEITFFDPTKYLCNLNHCSVVENNQAFYIDASHLSKLGALHLYGKAKSEINAFLNAGLQNRN